MLEDMKRPLKTEMNDYGTNQKRSRSYGYDDAIAEGKFELRVLIPSKAAGAVIGKGGAFIKDVRAKYDAIISVPDKTTPERVLTVICGQDKVADCFRELYVKLTENSFLLKDRELKDQREGEVKMLIHQSHAGAIIGRGGAKIKELREETGSNLKVFQECCPNSTDRILLITVDQTRMADVVGKVADFLKDVQIKGSQRPYDASNYDPHVNYGGFVDKTFNGGGGGGGPRGGGGGGGPPMPQLPSTHFDAYRSGGPPPYNPPQSMVGGYRPMGGGGPPPLMTQEALTTTQVTIPNELGGTIIGKGGDRINRVRTESGAKIEIGSSTYGNDERIITITGSPQQIQMAQYLLQQSVRTSEAGRRYLREQR